MIRILQAAGAAQCGGPLGRGFRAFERVGARPAQVLSRQLQRPSPGLTTWGASAKAMVACMRAVAAAAALMPARPMPQQHPSSRRPSPLHLRLRWWARAGLAQAAAKGCQPAAGQTFSRSALGWWVGVVGGGVGGYDLPWPCLSGSWGGAAIGRAGCQAGRAGAGPRARRPRRGQGRGPAGPPCCLCPRLAGWPGGAFSLQRLLGGGGGGIGLFTLHLRPHMPWGVPARGLWRTWRWGWLQGG